MLLCSLSFHVVYSYELQVEKQEERRGIGRTLMDILHRLGQHWELEKVMVTVFKCACYFLSLLSILLCIGTMLILDGTTDILIANTRALEFYFGCK